MQAWPALQQVAVQYTRCRPQNGAQASGWWRQDQGASVPRFGGNREE